MNEKKKSGCYDWMIQDSELDGQNEKMKEKRPKKLLAFQIILIFARFNVQPHPRRFVPQMTKQQLKWKTTNNLIKTLD